MSCKSILALSVAATLLAACGSQTALLEDDSATVMKQYQMPLAEGMKAQWLPRAY